MSGAPLYDKLMAYSSHKQSFHMPGHKFGSAANISQMDLALLDNTEVVGMDNLYEATGILKQAMDLMADFYASKNTLFMTNGSTTGILASILAVCKPNDKLIVARNAHHSVWNALILSGVIPIYVTPKYDDKNQLLVQIDAQAIKEALNQHKDAKGVLIVSPTYEGIVSDIQAIADIVHQYDKILIVDEAHGAHFILGDAFPRSSIQQGADLVIHSMHKTLPALGQSALLHICSNRLDADRVIQALRMVQTSSPSYMMMGLMDYTRNYILENRDNIYQNYIEPLIKLRQALKSLKHLKLLEVPTIHCDISKIVILTNHSDIDGYELSKRLNDEYHIVSEASQSNYIILMTTMADDGYALDILLQALIKIDQQIGGNKEAEVQPILWTEQIIIGSNLRDIYYRKKEWVSLTQCIDKIVAQSIMLYPPGIPIICIGEKLNDTHIEWITHYRERLQGIILKDNDILLQVISEE